jgi:hypothetical protein
MINFILETYNTHKINTEILNNRSFSSEETNQIIAEIARYEKNDANLKKSINEGFRLILDVFINYFNVKKNNSSSNINMKIEFN